MNKLLLLASVCALGFAAPAFAEDYNAASPQEAAAIDALANAMAGQEPAAGDEGAHHEDAHDEAHESDHHEHEHAEEAAAEMPADHGAPEGHSAPHMDDNADKEAEAKQESGDKPLEASAHADPMDNIVVEAPKHEDYMHADSMHKDKVHAHAKAHWGYAGDMAAEHWGSLDAKYAACSTGMEQSPINIREFRRNNDLGDIMLSYQDAPLHVVNNGHTIQVNVPEGSMAKVGEQVFNLLQLHFHTPSEHYIDGSPFPMELHFVHKNEAGALGVFGVMMKLGAENEAIQTIWENAPAEAGMENKPEGVMMNVASLLPAEKGYYAYDGSLTTPPCTEGVHWHVLKAPIEISQNQLVAFQALFPINARPVQPMHDRVVESK